MNNPRTIQTAFRFPPEMVQRIKHGGISSEVLDFAQRVRLSFSKEEISADPRLKYLIER